MSLDELPRFLDEELRRVDAFELEVPQSVHDLLLLNTSHIPCEFIPCDIAHSSSSIVKRCNLSVIN